MINDLLISLFIAVGISALGIFLAGMPGVMILWLSQPFLLCVYGPRSIRRIKSGGGFTLIYLVSMLWSLSILPGYLVAFRLFEDLAKLNQIAIFIGILYLGSVVITTIIYGFVATFTDFS
ncbi:hypothetical protein H6G20_12085 [Desertifilum sp. FACHB-1129]|uniref:Uncharacterized protein n=1 Tax=Desertifilum tharense IPPAS B-1220 TaxID=1781255 RepID=A0A1E5QN49_9CYAN|nr:MULTISPECIES: hypothetical protein [Desertifilum]MCD8488053.1 hypothetical protein [Desertifilum sp.]MDA0208578.1 hypothetical protein [Cyanobacteria bacterium FC1]MDI9640865.1 hypothetical protein [Geitlerinema splendidum]MBD2312400.1 hypothetical protein [Desertifilum sp. FACHB-1129]MBD2321183.1 hypothetical protein [Desertifilum sp. FACHB-866]